MKKFVLKAALISAGVLTVLVLLQSYFEIVVNNKQGYLAPMESADLSAAQVIILGDSHVNDAFASGDLPDRVLQLAYGGDSLKEMYLKAKYAIRRAPHLRCILLQADYHIFAGYRLVSNNQFKTFYFTDAGDLNRLYDGVDLSRLKKTLLTHVPIVYGPNRSAAMQVFVKHADTLARQIRQSGQVEQKTANWADRPPADRADEAADRIGRQFGDSIMEPELVSVFAEIIRMAGDRGIQVYGLRYPLTDEYLTSLPERVDTRKIDRAIEDAGLKSLLDYSSLYRTQPANFHNQDHLNQNGSRLFSARVFGDLLGLGCGETSS